MILISDRNGSATVPPLSGNLRIALVAFSASIRRRNRDDEA